MREGTRAFLEKRPAGVEGAIAVADVRGWRAAGAGLRFAIVVSRWNDFVTARLLAGAREALAEAGVADDDVDVVWVPGAFEVAAAARHVADAPPVRPRLSASAA